MAWTCSKNSTTHYMWNYLVGAHKPLVMGSGRLVAGVNASLRTFGGSGEHTPILLCSCFLAREAAGGDLRSRWLVLARHLISPWVRGGPGARGRERPTVTHTAVFLPLRGCRVFLMTS